MENNITFILASASPRRRKLLNEAGFSFEVCPSSANEINDSSLSPNDVALYNAVKKAEEVYARKNMPTLGADTVVAIDGEILGKPADRSINRLFLERLSGRTHEVVTGYCLIKDGKKYCGTEISFVKFFTLDDKVINSYVESGNGLDKAGGYGIQDGYDLVEGIRGSYTCVVGLPMEAVGKLLKEVL